MATRRRRTKKTVRRQPKYEFKPDRVGSPLLKKLVLTPQGRLVGSQVHQLFTGLNQQMVRGLSQEEQDAMRSILSKIEKNLSSEEL